MMLNEAKKNRAKRYSEEWNKLRLYMGQDKFKRSDLRKLARMRRLKYTHQICNAILADGFARVVDIDSNAEILQFTGKPIHYSFFMEIWDKRKDKEINLKGMELSTKTDLIRRIFKENPDAVQTEVAKVLDTTKQYVNRVCGLEKFKVQQKEEPFLSELAPNRKNTEVQPIICDMKGLSDKDLADELRRRGYDVTAKKTIEI